MRKPSNILFKEPKAPKMPTGRKWKMPKTPRGVKLTKVTPTL